jgi:hypothetical protein
MGISITFEVGDKARVLQTGQIGTVVKIDDSRPIIITLALEDINGNKYEKIFFEVHLEQHRE